MNRSSGLEVLRNGVADTPSGDELVAPAIWSRSAGAKIGVLLLISGSVRVLGCRTDISSPAIPELEYERPIVARWPTGDSLGGEETLASQSERRAADAGDGLEYRDLSDAQ